MTIPSAKPGMVCGRKLTVDPIYVPQVNYKGNTIHFCTESCLSAFLADPERFYSAHSKTVQA